MRWCIGPGGRVSGRASVHSASKWAHAHGGSGGELVELRADRRIGAAERANSCALLCARSATCGVTLYKPGARVIGIQ